MKSLSLLSTGSVCFALLACSTAAEAPHNMGGGGAGAAAGAPATAGAAPQGGSAPTAGAAPEGGAAPQGGAGPTAGSNTGGTDATAGATTGGAAPVAGAGGAPASAGASTGGTSSAGAAAAGAPAGGAGPVDATMFSGGWDGALLQYPCASKGTSVDCPNDSTCVSVAGQNKPSSLIPAKLNGGATPSTWTVGGDASKTYDVHVLIRGVVEGYNYVGGTIDKTAGTPATRLDLFGKDGAPQNNANTTNGSDYNFFLLTVTPATGTAKKYMLNAVQNSENPHTSPLTQHRSFAITEDKHIVMSGGSKVTLEVGDSNCVQIMNCGDQAGGSCTTPWKVPLDQLDSADPQDGDVHPTVFRQRLVRSVGCVRRPRRGREMRMSRYLIASLGFASVIFGSVTAHAEVVIAKPADGLEVYTAGRVGAFAELVDGDAQPPQIAGKPNPTADGIVIQSGPGPNGESNGARATAFRMRSGFMGNILTLGVRYKLTDYTTVSGQISIWATSETDGQRTYLRNFTDEREGFLKVEGPLGALTVGRQLSLFSRGAVQINFQYGHQFGVGAPVGFNELGPSGGHIGYGVLAPVFVAGMVYATPSFKGLKLTVGYFDAGTLVGKYWARTKAGRAETEATYDADFGHSTKLHVFANGAHQKLYGAQTTRQYRRLWCGGRRTARGWTVPRRRCWTQW